MNDLGTLGGNYSQASKINDNGQVVGWSSMADGSSQHAFFYSGGMMKDIGTLGGDYSQANGINSLGQVVGMSTMSANDYFGHAFLYSDGKMVDLNSMIDTNSGWTLYSAQAINDLGQIAGLGTNSLGQTSLFLLTPVGAPEPSAVCLSTIGLVSMLVFCRKPGGKAGRHLFCRTRPSLGSRKSTLIKSEN